MKLTKCNGPVVSLANLRYGWAEDDTVNFNRDLDSMDGANQKQ